MTAMQTVVAREAAGIADAVLRGAVLTDTEVRSAVILFRAVLRYAVDEGVDLIEIPELGRIVDALAYLTGTFREMAAGGPS